MTTPSEESARPAFVPGGGSSQGRPSAGPSRGFGGPSRGGPSAGGPGADRGARPAGGRRFYSRRKVCFFCANKDIVLNYKAVDGLRRYISERGRIEPRRKTGTCARHQRTLAVQIKRARQIALLPFTTDRPREYPQPIR